MRIPYSLYKGHPAPIIPLEITGRGGMRIVWAYVDSGASYSIFQAKETLRLGIELREGRRIFSVVGDGSLIPVYLFTLRVKIAKKKIEATIGFSERLGVGFNLLGRKDVFERFHVCFNDLEKFVSFTLL